MTVRGAIGAIVCIAVLVASAGCSLGHSVPWDRLNAILDSYPKPPGAREVFSRARYDNRRLGMSVAVPPNAQVQTCDDLWRWMARWKGFEEDKKDLSEPCLVRGRIDGHRAFAQIVAPGKWVVNAVD
jgi:hypothetical protein